PDDDAGVRALWQPGAAADHAADAARLSVAAGRDRDGAARHGGGAGDADRRVPDRQDRLAPDGRSRPGGGGDHADLAGAGEPERRLTGPLLAGAPSAAPRVTR